MLNINCRSVSLITYEVFSLPFGQQEAAKRKELEKGMVLKWSDPDQAVDVKKSTYYSPMRIEQEEKALSSGEWSHQSMTPYFFGM